MSAPSSDAARASPPVVSPSSRLMVVDEKNMLRLWLEEKVARHELTSTQADEMLHDQEAQGKLWVGPAKDMLGSAKLVYKIARDFGDWHGASVYFTKSAAGHDLVVFRGWPAGRKIVTGTRYRVNNPKIIEMQIGKPGLRAAAKESARFGVDLVVAVDVADYILRDNSTLGQLLGSLTIDIPSVVLAAAVGSAAGSFIATTTVAGLAAIGSLAIGPFLVAFGVGVLADLALYELDDHFGLTDKLSRLYDEGLGKLGRVWTALGAHAEARFNELANSHLVSDLRQEGDTLAERIGRQTDLIRAEITHVW